jgi:hypothetical protein
MEEIAIWSQYPMEEKKNIARNLAGIDTKDTKKKKSKMSADW